MLITKPSGDREPNITEINESNFTCTKDYSNLSDEEWDAYTQEVAARISKFQQRSKVRDALDRLSSHHFSREQKNNHEAYIHSLDETTRDYG